MKSGFNLINNFDYRRIVRIHLLKWNWRWFLVSTILLLYWTWKNRMVGDCFSLKYSSSYLKLFYLINSVYNPSLLNAEHECFEVKNVDFLNVMCNKTCVFATCKRHSKEKKRTRKCSFALILYSSNLSIIHCLTIAAFYDTPFLCPCLLCWEGVLWELGMRSSFFICFYFCW